MAFSVLFIDDEPDILNVFRLMSERFGDMAIEGASTAEEGFQLLEKKRYDAIVVDYDIPRINGIQFLKTLRARRDTTPVIFFTGAGREHTAIEALNNGANFYIKKADGPPHEQYKLLASMVKSAVDGAYLGARAGTSQKVIEDMIHFTSDPSFALDSSGMVIAWNEALEQLTDTPAAEMMGKRDLAYAEPLLGARKKTLLDLALASDDEIKRHKYMIISRVPKGPVIAVTRGKRKDGQKWTIWTKAMPLFDAHGNFIAVAGMVRDVTATFSDVVTMDAATGERPVPAEGESPAGSGGFLDKLLGKANAHYKEGAILMGRDRNYAGAIAAFDRALQIDDKLPYVWNDRGVCFRETGDYTTALKCCLRAVELAPENTECLYTLGETLEKIGLLNTSNKYLDSAIQVFKMIVNEMPNNMAAWNHIGICYKAMEKHDESRFYFDRARDIQLWKRDTPTPCRRNDYF